MSDPTKPEGSAGADESAHSAAGGATAQREGAPDERPAAEDAGSGPEASGTPAAEPGPAEPRSRPDEPAAEPPAAEQAAGEQPSAEEPAAAEEQAAGEQSSAEEPAAAQGQAAGEPSSAEQAAPAKPRPRRKPRYPALVRAWRGHRPVEGRVEQVIKGGYEVRLGKARAFCPHSQIERHREDAPERHVGQDYTFLITQLRRGGEDIVVSRRAVLQEAMADEAKAVRAALVEKQVARGRVISVADFGAFIDLGAGVMGLAHISELSHQRVQRVEDAVTVGQDVPVRILKIGSGERGKISLSLRQAVPDPWSGVGERFPAGQQVEGKVVRLADFGAFVELEPGVEGLAPASELPPAPEGWQAALQPGSTHTWWVLSTEPRRRRISLTLPGDPPGDPAAVQPDATLKGRVQRLENYGVFVWLAPGKVGLMPRAWTGETQGTDLARRFKIGDEVEVRVADVSEDGRRIRLASPGVDVEAQAAPAERSRGRSSRRQRDPEPAAQPEPQGAFGTSLADKLRDALDRGGR